MGIIELSTPRQAQRFKLDPSRRRLIFGMTGSGKTYWARFLDRAWARAGWPILIIDQDERYVDERKGQHYAEKPEKSTVASPWNITETGRLHPLAQVQLFSPEIPGWKDGRFLYLLDQVFEEGSRVLHFDDMYGVVEGYHLPTIMKKLWTSGRKKDIPVQALIQSARGFDRIIMRQSDDIDVFFMQDRAEREYISDTLGYAKLAEAAPKWAHWAYKRGEEFVDLVGALPAFEVR